MLRDLLSSPLLLTVPATALMVALGSTGLHLGAMGVIGGAALGAAWSVGLGLALGRLSSRRAWRRRLANGFVFLAVAASGVMLGGGIMYVLLMTAAVTAPLAVLSAMMQPAIPFFIILNAPLELLVVPGALVSNWRGGRRAPIAIGAASYYALRVWTYLAYVPRRMAIASRPLTADDMEWFWRSLGVDYRPLLVAVVLVAFTAAAFVPDGPARGEPAARP